MADKQTAISVVAAATLMLLAIWAPPSEASGKVRTVVLKNNGLSTMEQNAAAVFTAEARHAFRQNALAHHEALLEEVNTKFQTQARFVHSYTQLISGFAAVLTDEQVEYLKDHPDVQMVQNDRKLNDRKLELHTTYTPTFLKLNDGKTGVWKKTVGTDSIIGVIDTGIWPENPSFRDDGFGPVPSKFKGTCYTGDGTDGFKCNKKLIGARSIGDALAAYVNKTLAQYVHSCGDYLSPRDLDGHGTYVTGIAAGVPSPVALAGVSLGTARGVAYGARIVAYRVFFCEQATFSDFAKAIEYAVHDGVDVLSVSIGYSAPLPNGYVVETFQYYMAYLATRAGVAVVYSGGNDGPAQYTVGSTPPWGLTVGSGTVDRKFEATAVLGDGTSYTSVGVTDSPTPAGSPNNLLPLINSADAALNQSDPTSATLCFANSLDPAKVKGKIVVCTRGLLGLPYKAAAVASAGGLGCVITNLPGGTLVQYVYAIPTVLLSYEDGLKVKGYINTTESPTAYITPPKQVSGKEVAVAPTIAPSSSIGPNPDSFNILKPNVFAPGDNILSSYPPNSSNSNPATFVVFSGTSAASAHAAGAVALLADLHPSWTPSMLFSALATSATIKDNQGQYIRTSANVSATPFEMGSGQTNPDNAADPGLVYAVPYEKYSEYLCSKDAGLNSFYSFFNASQYCTTGYPSHRAHDLNVPSVTFYNISVGYRSITKRTLTSVGTTSATYSLTAVHPPGVRLSVYPTKLYFKAKESQTYKITVRPTQTSSTVQGAYATSTANHYFNATASWTFGSITWSDGKGHVVRIPLVVNAVKA